MWTGSQSKRLLRSLSIAAVLTAAGAPPTAAVVAGVGSYAPQIESADLGGTVRKTAWGDGAPPATVICFFDPKVSDCLLELSFLSALYRLGRDFGLSVYALEARGRQPSEVVLSLERYGTIYGDLPFPVLPDPDFRTGRIYGVQQLPVTFVAESHGVILNRLEGYGHGAAVEIARRIEQLQRRERGFFSPALREAGISEEEERQIETRLAVSAGTLKNVPAARALGLGDQVPELEFTDRSGRPGRWTWAGGPGGVRVVFFFGGLALTSIEQLTWLDELVRRGHDAGLEVLGVEASGLDAAALDSAVEKYRRFNLEPSFPVIADPEGVLARIFGSWERLPQTYLISTQGVIVYHADGFDAGEGDIIAGKVERSFQLVDRPFPPAKAAKVEAPSPSPVEEETPNVRKKREQDERYRSHIVQADTAFMAWDFERALTHYLAALEIEPKGLHPLERAAQIYERRGDPRLAHELWERVLAVRPDHVEAGRRVKELRPTR